MAYHLSICLLVHSRSSLPPHMLIECLSPKTHQIAFHNRNIQIRSSLMKNDPYIDVNCKDYLILYKTHPNVLEYQCINKITIRYLWKSQVSKTPPTKLFFNIFVEFHINWEGVFAYLYNFTIKNEQHVIVNNSILNNYYNKKKYLKNGINSSESII